MLNNKYSLGFFPTPLHALKNLTSIYPDYSIYIKRDDNTGLASGGNKTRKLEYLIQQAIDLGCDTIITAGAQQSNHCRQTAAACSQANLKCHLLLGGEKPNTLSGNLLLSSLLGAEIHYTGNNRKGEDIELLKKKLNKEGSNCFVIPYGGSNKIGALGFVNAVKELKNQLTEQKLEIDYLFFASSSGGTQAGLTLGLQLYNLNTRLIPISIDKEEINGVTLEENVLKIINEICVDLNIDSKFNLSEIYLNREYDNTGYGKISEEEQETINLLAKKEGILLDPVYTGRAFNAMLDILKNLKIPKNSKVLFWHTGGFTALFNSKNI